MKKLIVMSILCTAMCFCFALFSFAAGSGYTKGNTIVYTISDIPENSPVAFSVYLLTGNAHIFCYGDSAQRSPRARNGSNINRYNITAPINKGTVSSKSALKVTAPNGGLLKTAGKVSFTYTYVGGKFSATVRIEDPVSELTGLAFVGRDGNGHYYPIGDGDGTIDISALVRQSAGNAVGSGGSSGNGVNGGNGSGSGGPGANNGGGSGNGSNGGNGGSGTGVNGGNGSGSGGPGANNGGGSGSGSNGGNGGSGTGVNGGNGSGSGGPGVNNGGGSGSGSGGSNGGSSAGDNGGNGSGSVGPGVNNGGGGSGSGSGGSNGGSGTGSNGGNGGSGNNGTGNGSADDYKGETAKDHTQDMIEISDNISDINNTNKSTNNSTGKASENKPPCVLRRILQ